MTEPLLTDEVWTSLDPSAGRLSRRTRQRVVVAVVAVVVLIVATYVVRQSGVVRPHLYAGDTLRADADPVQHTFFQTVVLGNSGWHSVRITGIAPPSAGLRVTDVDGVPVTISGQSSTTITVHYAVTDCAAVMPGDTPIAYRVHQW